MDLDALKDLSDRCLLRLYASARRILARPESRRPAGWRQSEADGELAFAVLRERHQEEMYHHLLDRMHRQEAGQFRDDFDDAIQQTFLEVVFWRLEDLHEDLAGLLCNHAWWRLCDILKKTYGIRPPKDPASTGSRRRWFNNPPEGLLERKTARPSPIVLLEDEDPVEPLVLPPAPLSQAVDARLRRILDRQPPDHRAILEAYYLRGQSIDDLVANRPAGSPSPGLYENALVGLFVDFARQVYEKLPTNEGERLLANLLRAQESGDWCRDMHLQAILEEMSPEDRAIVCRYCFQDTEMQELTGAAADPRQATRRINRTIFRFNQRVRARHPDAEQFLRNQVRALRRQLAACGVDAATLNALEEEYDSRPGEGRLRSQLLIELNRARTHLAEGRDASGVQQRLEKLLRKVRKG
jgi:hypothetical protein